MEATAVPINKELIDQFRHETISDHPGQQQPVGGENSVQHLNEALGWLLKTADTQLKKIDDRMATDPETLDRISELSVIVAQRNLSDSVLRNSPEIFLGTILTGLAFEKWMLFQQIQKEQAKQESKSKDADSNE